MTEEWRMAIITERAQNPEMIISFFFPSLNMYVIIHRVTGEVTLLAHPNSALSILDYTMKVERNKAANDLYEHVLRMESEEENATTRSTGSVLAGYLCDLEAVKATSQDVFFTESIASWERIPFHTLSDQVVNASSTVTLLHLKRLLEEYESGPVSQLAAKLLKKDLANDTALPITPAHDDFIRKEAFMQLLSALEKLMEKSIQEASTQTHVNQFVSRLVTEPVFLEDQGGGMFKLEGNAVQHVVLAIPLEDWDEMKNALSKKTPIKKSKS